MDDRLAAGPLIGRPFGGTAMLINKNMLKPLLHSILPSVIALYLLPIGC